MAAAVDYYGVLGLQRTCTQLDVKAAFRRAALRLHPDRARLHCQGGPSWRYEHRDDFDVDARRFTLAARAFEVLVDPRTRAAYDLHGETCLPSFHGDPHLTFRRFFGTDNPFLAQLRDRVHFDLEEPEAPEPLQLPLRVTLEEVNEGASKTCRACIRLPAERGGDTSWPRDFTVDVLPGTPSGTKYMFAGQGHQAPGRPPGDVVLVLDEVPHPEYRREGADLVRCVAVSLREALTGCTVKVRTLDGRLLRVAITDIVRPGYERRLAGEGLPLPPREPGAAGSPAWCLRGDLVLRMDVIFPVTLPRTSKALLDQSFQLAEQLDHGVGVRRALGMLPGAPVRLENKNKTHSAKSTS